jgi:hypothetical protein
VHGRLIRGYGFGLVAGLGLVVAGHDRSLYSLF